MNAFWSVAKGSTEEPKGNLSSIEKNYAKLVMEEEKHVTRNAKIARENGLA